VAFQIGMSNNNEMHKFTRFGDQDARQYCTDGFAGGNLTGYNTGIQSCEVIAIPTISMFCGILISMYVFDTEKHHLLHIHVRYNEFKA